VLIASTKHIIDVMSKKMYRIKNQRTAIVGGNQITKQRSHFYEENKMGGDFDDE
jgi:hypothetical protein